MPAQTLGRRTRPGPTPQPPDAGCKTVGVDRSRGGKSWKARSWDLVGPYHQARTSQSSHYALKPDVEAPVEKVRANAYRGIVDEADPLLPVRKLLDAKYQTVDLHGP